MRISIAGQVRLLSASRAKASDIRRAMDAVTEHQQMLLAKWDEIHGRNKRR